MALHDKMQEKKQKKEQKALDGKQDDEIKKLQEELKQMNSKKDRSRSSSRSRSSRRRRRRRDSSEEDEEFRRSSRKARAMIEQQYEDNLMRIGPRYAQGDVITENKLQAQIIQLQQTVINVLQDALLNERSLTKADINKLIAAQQAARDGSMDALNGQYSRMIAGAPPPRQRLLPEAQGRRDRFIENEEPPPRPMQRQLTLPALQQRSPSPLRRAQTAPAPSPHLFCRYSEELQFSRKPLTPSFDPGSSHRCPACSLHIRVSASDAWILEMRKPVLVNDGYGGEQQAISTRTYEVGGRFVVKCHTEEGEFACVLCQQHRDVDTMCGNVESLVQHLGQSHNSDQF